MDICDFLDPRAVVEEFEATNRKEALEALCRILSEIDPTLNLDEMVEVLLERERLGCTGLGEGVAIPHGRLSNLDRLVACFAKSTKGVEFEAIDDKPVHLFFLLLAPASAAGIHLKALAKIARLFRNPCIREELFSSSSRKDIYEILTGKDNPRQTRKTDHPTIQSDDTIKRRTEP